MWATRRAPGADVGTEQGVCQRHRRGSVDGTARGHAVGGRVPHHDVLLRLRVGHQGLDHPIVTEWSESTSDDEYEADLGLGIVQMGQSKHLEQGCVQLTFHVASDDVCMDAPNDSESLDICALRIGGRIDMDKPGHNRRVKSCSTKITMYKGGATHYLNLAKTRPRPRCASSCTTTTWRRRCSTTGSTTPSALRSNRFGARTRKLGDTACRQRTRFRPKTKDTHGGRLARSDA